MLDFIFVGISFRKHLFDLLIVSSLPDDAPVGGTGIVRLYLVDFLANSGLDEFQPLLILVGVVQFVEDRSTCIRISMAWRIHSLFESP